MILAHDLPDWKPTPGTTERVWLGVGHGWTGPVQLPLIVVCGAQPGPKLVVIAAQHGDEGYAVLGVQDVANTLEPPSVRGQVWLLPCLNVHGFVHGKRNSPFDAQDMNRVHPGDKSGTVTQQIAFALSRFILPGSDLLLDLHGGSPEVGDIAFGRWTDAPGRPSVRPLAESLPLHFLLEPSARGIPGMLSRATPELGVPQLAIEACSTDHSARDNALEMASFITTAMRYLGMLDGERPTPRGTPVMRTVSNPARVGGAFCSFVRLGEPVQAGQKLGEVRDLLGVVVQEVVSSVDGLVAVMRTGVRVHPGESLITLATPLEGTP